MWWSNQLYLERDQGLKEIIQEKDVLTKGVLGQDLGVDLETDITLDIKDDLD